jgi:hypothetical protein
MRGMFIEGEGIFCLGGRYAMLMPGAKARSTGRTGVGAAARLCYAIADDKLELFNRMACAVWA